MTGWAVRTSLPWLLLLVLLPFRAAAQDEGSLHAAFARERDALAASCGHVSVGGVGSCVYTLATAQPWHVTFGSIAPQNGLAVGPALVWHATPSERWRINWSGDAVAAAGGAWRAGAYANFVRTEVRPPVPVSGDQPMTRAAPDVYPVYSLYAQTVSLHRLGFYGSSVRPEESAHANWALRQTLAGGGAVVPVGPGGAGVALVAGVTMRRIAVDGRAAGDVPAVGDLFAAPPGLGDRRTYAQLTGGVRVAPAVGAVVQPLYSLAFDRFVAGDDRAFTRWSVGVDHAFPLYRIRRPSGAPGNTPNDCTTAVSDVTCPAASRGRYGTITLTARTVGSPASSRVPFYLQPTLGGADINGVKALASYPDYFLRAPNVLSLQASVEHSLVAIPLGHGFALPLGAFAMVEGGSARDHWRDLFDRLERSYSAGLTIRAGGFPEVFVLYAWGGGTHVSATVNTALLGGGRRPSLD